MTDTATALDWRAQAECAYHDPELFHPDREEDARWAIAICRTCPVADKCLEYAMADPELSGVWGGTTLRQRRRVMGRSRRRW